MTRAVIVSTARTPLAKSWKGAFNMTHGATLGGHAVRAAKHGLIQRPEHFRADEGLIVEAHRQEALYKARERHDVEIQRRPSVLMAHL